MTATPRVSRHRREIAGSAKPLATAVALNTAAALDALAAEFTRWCEVASADPFDPDAVAPLMLGACDAAALCFHGARDLDGDGDLWWLALEKALAQLETLTIRMDGVARTFTTRTCEEKDAAFHAIYWWLRRIDEADAVMQALVEAHGEAVLSAMISASRAPGMNRAAASTPAFNRNDGSRTLPRYCSKVAPPGLASPVRPSNSTTASLPCQR